MLQKYIQQTGGKALLLKTKYSMHRQFAICYKTNMPQTGEVAASAKLNIGKLYFYSIVIN